MPQLGIEQVGAIKAATAGAGALLLALGAWRRARGRAPGRAFDWLLALLGALAAACWWNLGRFHYPGFGHPSETYIYFVGSKYFAELGYTLLYRCTALAEAEDGRRAEVEARHARDLDTNRLTPAAELLRDPGICRSRFTPQRWRSFRRDVRFFRKQVPAARWNLSQVDHGYNATPAWGLLGGLVSRGGPASGGRILALRLLDPLLLLAAGVAVARAFGWRTLCVVLLYWGTNYPALYGWVGGSVLRQVELAGLLVAIAALRRGRSTSAGALVGLASLVRVFPAVALAGVALRATWNAIGTRRIALAPAHRRFAAGALAAAALLVPLSGLAAGGLGAWVAFAERSRTLLETPLRNHVGLRTLLAWNPAATSRALQDPSRDDPFAPWKAARQRTFAGRRALFAAGVAGFGVLLAAAVRRAEDWSATVLALGLVPVAFELTCYYWALLAAYGLLWGERPWIGAALCALSALGWAIADRSYYFDDAFTWISLATLAFVVGATAACLAAPRSRPAPALRPG
jgi:hypothetical protein